MRVFSLYGEISLQSLWVRDTSAVLLNWDTPVITLAKSGFFEKKQLDDATAGAISTLFMCMKEFEADEFKWEATYLLVASLSQLSANAKL